MYIRVAAAFIVMAIVFIAFAIQDWGTDIGWTWLMMGFASLTMGNVFVVLYNTIPVRSTPSD